MLGVWIFVYTTDCYSHYFLLLSHFEYFIWAAKMEACTQRCWKVCNNIVKTGIWMQIVLMCMCIRFMQTLNHECRNNSKCGNVCSTTYIIVSCATTHYISARAHFPQFFLYIYNICTKSTSHIYNKCLDDLQGSIWKMVRFVSKC